MNDWSYQTKVSARDDVHEPTIAETADEAARALLDLGKALSQLKDEYQRLYGRWQTYSENENA